MSALSAWRCQPERTFNSGATMKSEESLPLGTCAGLVSKPPVSSIAGNSVKAPARKPTGANGSTSTAVLRRVGVAIVGTTVCTGTGEIAAPRRAGSGAGRVATADAAALAAGADAAAGGAVPALGFTAAPGLRRSVLVESKPVTPAPDAGGLP